MNKTAPFTARCVAYSSRVQANTDRPTSLMLFFRTQNTVCIEKVFLLSLSLLHDGRFAFLFGAVPRRWHALMANKKGAAT